MPDTPAPQDPNPDQPRTLAEIDKDLRTAVRRRSTSTSAISKYSQAVVADTRWIDQLLAERTDVSDAAILAAALTPADAPKPDSPSSPVSSEV